MSPAGQGSEPARPLAPGQALALPLRFAGALLAFGVLGPARHSLVQLAWLLSLTGLLCAWAVALVARGRTLKLEIAIKKQHYVQACAHLSIFVYWGWYWPEVYGHALFILAQLAFAYAFDCLLTWSRRDSYVLGFGPFPVIFSINLFLWFREDWFELQLLMVALGFAAKEFIRWNKEGRSAHIFNPSSFPLSVVSITLLIANASDATWVQEISVTQFFPPHMYLFLFLVALPGQYFFGVTLMTLSAVLTTYLTGLVYFTATGAYLFGDSYIPIAVFLGMHFLFTDPSTAPRSELGRVIFGVAYGLSVIAAVVLLERAHLPGLYDKLLPVPLLNLSIRRIDRVARAVESKLRWSVPLVGRQRHLAYMGVWASVFTLLSATQAIGDDHPGQWLPFWQEGCRLQRQGACDHLAHDETNYCGAGSGWACNELGIAALESRERGAAASQLLSRGCRLGFQPACVNAQGLKTNARPPAIGPPTVRDYPIVLSGNKGRALTGYTPAELTARACAQGWKDACEAR